MNDVARLVLEAWEKLGPGIMGDSDELARRLARRRRHVLTRPVRAWCLAIRATDTRITAAHWVISPEHAMDVDHPGHPYEPIEHEVTIRPHALRKFCRAVRTDSWGEQVHDVAKKLGCHISTILSARYAGKFTERFVKGLGGKHCRYPIPLIHSWTTLDPGASNHFARPDALWGALWEFLPDMMPDDFEQTVIRRPHYRWMVPKDHPGREFGEGRQFNGWRWICPACKEACRTIYCPLPPQTVFDYLGCDPAVNQGRCERAPERYVRYDAEALLAPPLTFACRKCHKVESFSRTNSGMWNAVVTQLTRGMLYGHEVQKPDWYKTERKKARSRRMDCAAPRREAVLRRVLNGWTAGRIARDLMMSLHYVHKSIRILCRQERVADRVELAVKLGSPHEQPLNQKQNARRRRKNIERLLLEGVSYREMCAMEGLSFGEVNAEANRIYRKHGLPRRGGRVALAKKLGIAMGGRYAVNEEISARLMAGQSNGEIAEGMGITRRAVEMRVSTMCRIERVSGRKKLLEKMGGGAVEARGGAVV